MRFEVEKLEIPEGNWYKLQEFLFLLQNNEKNVWEEDQEKFKELWNKAVDKTKTMAGCKNWDKK